MTKQRMTLNEVCEDMRRNGMPMTQKTLADGIEAGVFPFGTIVGKSEVCGKRNIIIMRRDYEDWKIGAFSDDPVFRDDPAPSTFVPSWNQIASWRFTQEDGDTMWEFVIRRWERRRTDHQQSNPL